MMEATCSSRKEREKLRQRQDILAVALGLFSEKGYHNVSMGQIAERAEFAIGTLYRFFQNKEDLYTALVLERCDAFEEAVIRSIEEPDNEIDKLRGYIRTKGEQFSGNLPFVRLFLAERRGPSFNLKAGLDEQMRKRHYAMMQRLAGIFQSATENGRFKNIADPFHLAVSLDSVIDAFLLLWLDAPDSHPYPKDPDAILNIFCQGLMSR